MNSQRDMEKMYNLLWQVYGEEKNYIDSDQSTRNTLQDEYEGSSIKIGAFEGEVLLGMIRVIIYSKNGFYAEKDFNINLTKIPINQTAELSRLIVIKSLRNKLVSFGLLKKALETSKKNKIKFWILVTSPKIKESFAQSFNIKISPLEIGKLTEEHLKTRERMINYYKICDPLPYWISIDDI